MPGTLEEIALRWVPGSGAVLVQPLTMGLVNVSCRVEREGRAYSLRVAAADVEALGLDREWECRVLQRACAAGLTPLVRQCQPENGIVVAEWLNGHTWSAAQTGRATTLEAVAGLLRRVHALSIPQPARVMSPCDWIAHYTPGAAPQLRAGAGRCLQELATLSSANAVLCHSDVHRLNILRAAADGRILLLDWEYAHVSDGFWDLAGWLMNSDLPGEAASRLLGAYLQRVPEPAESRRLQLMCWLYDYVCLLWSESYARQRAGADAAAVAARATLVAGRLVHSIGGRAG